ncbi:interleukin-1 receptor-associated kinase 1-binding protein 1 homolog [Gadus chalcogrammus]|uniref:interleukin-1 receptor-associated kinase 1-binding protein 1 homolog n=1 Tax=Gadus chalcogrammus TaxID=1042646 RepID=UPI0024C4E2DF|nr:interleukin-1 receptor-associated kinase 1-binding protein 1 homolog [Gadus chalcogrammus]
MDNQNRVCFDSGDSAPHRQRGLVSPSTPPQRGPRVREVQVTGFAEDSRQADRVTLSIRVSSSKESASDASSSVSRRLEYIQQTLRQHGVKEEVVSVKRSIHRENDVYHMQAEAAVDFSDFHTMDRVCCVLLEKLDKSVSIGSPRFHHSKESLSNLRCRVCLEAVENAQRKASDLSHLLGQTLGPPLLVREEETREWRSPEDGDEEQEGEDGVKREGEATCSVTHRRTVAWASARVSVTFTFLDKARKKH